MATNEGGATPTDTGHKTFLHVNHSHTGHHSIKTVAAQLFENIRLYFQQCAVND